MIAYRNRKTYHIDDARFYVQLPELTKVIGESYPGHFKWLQETFIGGLQSGNQRGYSFAVDYGKPINFRYGSLFDTVDTYQLAGCSLLKDTPEEKKLCCLFVDPNYRYQGIASQLVENSFELLNTTHPVLTVSENNKPMLDKLLKRYNFILTNIKDSVYKPGIKEYYYNEGMQNVR